MAFVAVTMLFSGCKKDQSELILGTWYLDGAKSYNSIRYGEMDNTQYMDDRNYSLTFKSDGTVDLMESEGDEEPEIETETYTIADGVLTVTDDDDPVSMTIDKLTETELSLTKTDSYDVQGMNYTMVIHYEFTR